MSSSIDCDWTLHPFGSTTEARDVLRTGFGAIERFAPTFLALLTTMTLFSRMVLALAPQPILQPRRLCVRSLHKLVASAQGLGRSLTASTQRLGLHFLVVRLGFGLMIRYLVRASRRLFSHRSNREWEQISLIRRDQDAIMTETIMSFRALLHSLPQEHMDRLVPLVDGRESEPEFLSSGPR